MKLRAPTVAALGWLVLGCVPEAPAPAPSTTSATSSASSSARWVDATDDSGMAATHRNGASVDKYLPETMGAGVAIFDADGDGHADVYLVGGLAVADLGNPAAAGHARLYLGRGDGTFVDATVGSGLDGPHLGMGAAVGDVDNDGDLDLVVTGVGGDRLFENRSADGAARFVDVTALSGLDAGPSGDAGDVGFSSSAAFLDADLDGFLDLYIGRYVVWSPAGDLPCRPDGVHRSYCTPEAYPEAVGRFYRNRGDGRFDELGASVGLDRPGKTLGVAAIELDEDRRPELVLANDTTRNFLFRNRGERFDEVGLDMGIALGQSGAPRGAMGIDVGDLDGDLRPELVIGNFSQEMSAVYRLGEGGIFVDEAARWGVGLDTLMPLAFGVKVLDLDLDGALDLVFLHGHIEPDIERWQPLQHYAQPMLVFRNRGDGTFEPRPDAVPSTPWVGRGLAAGDLDGDGDLDLVLTQNGGPARLLRNESGGRSLRLRLEGTASNRTGYGARVDVEVDGHTRRRHLTSGRSYLSADEPILTFGLGKSSHADKVTILWPSGRLQELGPMPSGLHVVREPS